MTDPNTALVEFVRDRITEDADAAMAAAWNDPKFAQWRFAPLYGAWSVETVGLEGTPGYQGSVAITCDSEGLSDSVATPEAGRHIAAWDPARVLAVCAAHRRIVDDYQEAVAGSGSADVRHGRAQIRRHQALLALAHVAAIYDDHPDYDEDWRP